MSFGALLTTYRQRTDLSINGLARAVGVDPSYISRIENDSRVMPRAGCMQSLVAVLGLNLAEQQAFALVGMGLLDAADEIDRVQHTTTMRAANAILAACPCSGCVAQRAALAHTA